MPNDPDSSAPLHRSYIRFDWDLPDEELELQIMVWLESILGPPEIDDVKGGRAN
jgi:hypothetical protein